VSEFDEGPSTTWPWVQRFSALCHIPFKTSFGRDGISRSSNDIANDTLSGIVDRPGSEMVTSVHSLVLRETVETFERW